MLAGGIFWSNDTPRIAALAAADLAITGWFLIAAFDLRRPRPAGFLGVGVYLLIRAIVEARYLAGLLFRAPPRNPGSTSGIKVSSSAA